jgi:hypothetical protein
MDLTKILELLGANKLDESTQENLTEKLGTVIEVEAKKLLETKLEEEKSKLVEHYEEKFEDYKADMTTKFSNFVDGVLDEEMVIPEQVLEYAKKGELYHDLIEQFKVRLSVDQGLLDEEVKSLLKEAKEEIIKLREDMDSTIQENLELKGDAQEMASELYLHKKCQGLTESQKQQVFDILSGVTDKAEIDRKFQVISDSERFEPVNIGDGAGEKVIEKEKKKSDPKNNEKQVEEDDDEKGKGIVEQDDDDDDDDDDENGKNGKKKKKNPFEKKNGNGNGNGKANEDSPFAEYSNRYLEVLRESKI